MKAAYDKMGARIHQLKSVADKVSGDADKTKKNNAEIARLE